MGPTVAESAHDISQTFSNYLGNLFISIDRIFNICEVPYDILHILNRVSRFYNATNCCLSATMGMGPTLAFQFGWIAYLVGLEIWVLVEIWLGWVIG